MATLAIGDIHGYLPPLVDLLTQLEGAVTGADVVVFLGDYIDRGPDSRKCVDAILEFRERSSAGVICLRGNHEDWLSATRSNYRRHSWLFGMEAFDTIRSYSAEAERMIQATMRASGLLVYSGHQDLPYGAFFDAMPKSHAAFFSTLALSFENEDCVCTHAGLDPSVAALSDQTADALVWGHHAFLRDYQREQIVVYGHWNNAELDSDGWPRPRIMGNTIGIDTIAHGVLTAIRLPDRVVFQSAKYESAVRAR
jgi:serine/threonine protein phosphatase 1